MPSSLGNARHRYADLIKPRARSAEAIAYDARWATCAAEYCENRFEIGSGGGKKKYCCNAHRIAPLACAQCGQPRRRQTSPRLNSRGLCRDCYDNGNGGGWKLPQRGKNGEG